MKFADLLKQSTASTSAAVLTLGAAVDKFRTLAQAIADGELSAGDQSTFMVRDAAGKYEFSLFTVTNATTLTRVAVRRSSNNNAAETFGTGTVVANMPDGEWLSQLLSAADGVDISTLAVLSSLGASDHTLIMRAGAAYLAPVSLLGSGAGTPPADTTAPAPSSAQVANATPTVIQITMNEGLANSVPPASAFTVSGGKTVSSVAVSGLVVSLTVNSAYVNGNTITVGYTQPAANPRLQDAAGNPVASFTGYAVTNNVAAAATVAPGQVTGLTAGTSTETTQALTWAAPSTGTAPFTYSVERSPAGANTWTSVASGITTTSYTVTGLTAATSYDYRVTASNSAGAGTPSATVNKSTTAAASMADTYRLTNTNSAGMSGGATYQLSLVTGDYQGQGGSYTKTSDGTVVPALNVRVNVRDANGNSLLQAPKFAWGILGEAAPATFSDTALAIGANGIATGRGNGLVTTTRLGSWGDTATTSGQYGTYQVGSSLYAYVGQSVPSANGRNGTVPMVLWVLFPDGSRKMHDNNQGQGNPIVYYFTTNAL